MKTIKYLLWILVPLCVTACGENPESYRDKILEGYAKKLNTTKELFVEDFGIQIDSMSLTTFCVEDSIAFITQRHELLMKQKPEELKETEQSIKYLKEQQSRSLFFSFSSSDAIVDLMVKRDQIKREIKDDNADYEAAMKSLPSRNPKEVLFKVVTFRVAMKDLLKQIHELHRTAEFFTPDGETFCADVSEAMKNFVVDRERKKHEKK